MEYKIKFVVKDSNNNTIRDEKLTQELTEPTVASIKTLLNPNTYTNIKSERFVGNGKENPWDSEVLKTSFIAYYITL
jgi:hypothetical protein